MITTRPKAAVSNTGPLISALQSGCMHVLFQFYDWIHVPDDEILEFQKHGAGQEIRELAEIGFLVVHQDFTPEEKDAAKTIAKEIADHHATRDRVPDHHLPESLAIVLAQRDSIGAIELLIDELAAREAARRRRVPIIGFPGILIRACRQGIMNPENVKSSLEECRIQGTHYSSKLIDEVYEGLKRP